MTSDIDACAIMRRVSVESERIFGPTITNSDGKSVPTRIWVNST